jgi:mannitol/fructose-specific phosphotransferase system IIA component (Ntr-type)
MDGETKARIMIGKFIRKHIFTEDFQTGRLKRQKLFKIIRSQINYYVAPESGLTPYRCQQMANEIFKAYMDTDEYQAYKHLVREARLQKMTPEQYFNSIMIKRETERSTITKEDGSELYANMS